jgi:hypothetical protein
MKLEWGSLLIGGALAYLFHDKIAELIGQKPAAVSGPSAGWGALHINNPRHRRRRNPYGAVYDPYAGYRRR